MPFGLWTRAGPRNYILNGGAQWHNLANTIEPSMYGSNAALFCQITLSTCSKLPVSFPCICQMSTRDLPYINVSKQILITATGAEKLHIVTHSNSVSFHFSLQ